MITLPLSPDHAARLLIRACVMAGRAPSSVLRGLYDPDQPRDESGKWTNGAGGTGRGPGRFQQDERRPIAGPRNPRGFPEDDYVRGEDLPDRIERALESSLENSENFKDVHMSWEAKEAQQQYQGGQYVYMSLNVKTDGEQYEELTPAVQALQEALMDDQLYLRDPIVTYRGISVDNADDFIDKLEVGSTLKTSGFQSSASDPETAAKFLSSSGGVTGTINLDRGVMLEIRANQGLHLGGETEFLMPHGSQYRVVAIKDMDFNFRQSGIRGTRKVVQIEQIGVDDGD